MDESRKIYENIPKKAVAGLKIKEHSKFPLNQHFN